MRVLIKDNHIAIAGDIRTAIERARAAVGHMVKVEVEVDTLDQLEIALAAGVDAILLDNRSIQQLTRAVAMVDGRATTEASGRITPATAPAIAATGVDLISVGWLTHSARNPRHWHGCAGRSMRPEAPELMRARSIKVGSIVAAGFVL